MKKQNPKISYDKESQVMSIELGRAKSVDSDISGNVVIDYDKNGKVARVNFYEFNFDNFRAGLKVVKEFTKKSDIAFSVK